MSTIEILENQLQTLRDEFETTRPLCPSETRPFTYQKLKKGKNFKRKDVENWEWVTINSVVALRSLNDPKSNQRCHELSQEIINVKAQIKAQTLQEQDK
jgi:hypothetical protein